MSKLQSLMIYHQAGGQRGKNRPVQNSFAPNRSSKLSCHPFGIQCFVFRHNSQFNFRDSKPCEGFKPSQDYVLI
jgi:hypothetical protein